MSAPTITEKITLWTQDYNLLFSTDNRDEAKQWFLDSGHEWLPIVIDYGTDWHQRWSGRIERLKDGGTEIRQDREYLTYVTTWPTLDLT